MTNYLCVGIARRWNEGEFNGRPYRNLRIYYTHDDADRIDGVEAGYFTVKSLPKILLKYEIIVDCNIIV